MLTSTESMAGWFRFDRLAWLPKVAQTLFAGLVVFALLGSVVYLGYRYDTGSEPISQVMAQRTATSAVPEAGQYQPVTLPRRLCPASLAPCFDHYRLLLPSGDTPLGVFVPSFAGSVRVTVNGEVVAQFGNLDAPIERLLFIPAFVEIPQRLRGGDLDELIITIGADRGHYLRLSPFYVGDVGALQGAYRITHWLSVDLLVASTGVYLVLAFLALLTHRMARENALFPWFAVIVLCAAARNSFFLWTDPAYDFVRGMIYFQASLGELAGIVGFTGALVGVGRQRMYQWIAWLSPLLVMVFGVGIAIDNYSGSYYANVATQGLAVLAGGWSLVMVIKYLLSGWHFVKPWVCGFFIAAFLLTLHDVRPTAVGMPVNLQLSNLAPLCLVIAFCFILAQQFSSALRRVQAHNVALTAAVAQKEQDLHTAYQDIRRAEREQAVETERVRILQDVHDGVGGRLAGLVMLARRKGDVELAGHIEESLADLRLIIDSLDDELTDDLGLALAMFRERTHDWLNQLGLQVSWTVDCPAAVKVTPAWMVAVLRVLQELLNNVVKHAAAQRVKISAVYATNLVRFEVQDDGVGIERVNEAMSKGRGLNGVARRLESLGGYFECVSSTALTRMIFTVPLPSDPHVYGGFDGP